jgi:hypothetical protein
MLPMTLPWHAVLVATGMDQLILVAASLAIPRALVWPQDVAKLRPLTRQVFWNYAGYIWATNLCFGLVSARAPLLLQFRAPLQSTSLAKSGAGGETSASPR